MRSSNIKKRILAALLTAGAVGLFLTSDVSAQRGREQRNEKRAERAEKNKSSEQAEQPAQVRPRREHRVSQKPSEAAQQNQILQQRAAAQETKRQRGLQRA